MSETAAAASAPSPTAEAAGTPLDALIATVAQLRGPGGCPWDAEQTHASLVQYLVEETHELVDAIEAGGREEMIEELGDVLYQVILHSDIAEHTEGEAFTVQDVAATLNAKLIGRHPHVFGDVVAETSEDVVAFWDDLKAAEKPERTSVLDGIPQGMPSLGLADKLLGKATKLGLIDSDPDAGIPFGSEDELGSMLLAIVASAKARGLDAERALRSTLRDFQAEIREAEGAE
ncbi:MazG family protein [Microterricola viridarii]|uniref:Nucleoside triphosphate hydrolase n=1 Tax=Microterricola viridarii TaxID=412690 RepID=A0A0X8E3K3_9MICO|nr:MazG family protein [Microterricola viridarii]AMB59092.1 nucleoside triphosphate hydrolase [Microterricola viridarii]